MPYPKPGVARVLTDFAQLTPHRAATVTSDPYHPRRVHVAVSGVAPQGPAAPDGSRPTSLTVRVQRRNPAVATDLGWEDVPETIAGSKQPATPTFRHPISHSGPES